MRRRGLIAGLASALVVGGGGCTKTRTFALPELGDVELVFAALYDAGGRVAAVGPVLTRPAVKSSGYALEGSSGELVARVFLLQDTALLAAAQSACAGLSSRSDQRACADLVESCRLQPAACLTVLPAEEQCGARLELPKEIELTVLESQPDGDLEAAEDPAAAKAALSFCGPVVLPSCPNVLPGYTITEGGTFRCAAPAKQAACAAELDLSDCGLGGLRATVDAAGALSGVAVPPCSLAPIEASDEVLGSRDRAFALTCGSRRFVATPMELLFGEPGCARRGPPLFNEAQSERAERYASLGVGTGRITGVKSFQPAGWEARYLFSGTGHDTCAIGGCIRSGGGCNNECGQECSTFVTLPDCNGANAWDPCTGSDAVEECLARCRSACVTASDTCHEEAIGHALALSSPNRPEETASMVDLDAAAEPEEGPMRPAGLALLGERGVPRVAVASRRGVRVFEAQAADTLLELPTAERRFDVDVAGIAAVPGRPSELLVFGVGSSGGALLHLQLTGATDPVLVDSAPASSSNLPTIDAIATGGLQGTWVYAASLAPPLGTEGSGRIEVFTIDGSEPPPPVDLPGRPTAITSLPGGAALVALAPGGGARDALVILVPELGVARQAAMLPVPGGLGVTAAHAEPSSCATRERCRVYLGYRQDGPSAGHGVALVGVLEYDRSDPAASRVLPTFVKTTAEDVSFLELDVSRNELLAVASSQNRITPIRLW